MIPPRLLISLCLLLPLASARAANPPLPPPAQPYSSRLPEDTLGFIEVDPAAGRPNSPDADSSPNIMDMGFQALQSLGILPRDVTVAGDAFGLAAMAGNRHFCIGWLDADLQPGPHDGLMCNSFQLVWLVDTHGRPDEMLHRITALLDHLSTRETSHQVVKKAADNGREYVEFTDSRWPAWLKLGWTQEKDVFVMAMGDGAMAHYLADHPVGGSPGSAWQPTVDAIDHQAPAAGSAGIVFARIYVNPDAFRQRFPDAMKRTLLGRVFAAMDLNTTDKALFSARRNGRAVSLDYGASKQGGGRQNITVTPWTLPPNAAPALTKLVPDDATSYLVLNVDWPTLYTRITAVLDAILTDEGEPSVDQKVRRFAALHHVDLQKDVLTKASPLILVHDWPQHPLGIPLMVTAIASAGTNGPVIKADLDRMLKDAQQSLDKRPKGIFKLRTDSDGVMYMQFGLVGPAWGWAGNRLVWSWSPAAVHDNLAAAANAPAGAFTNHSP
ncbi:MAG TPA: hypothetical protein VHQ47_04280 [Phycisphaerae bacterium]|nr:hypothetical protein [Phycisphaerae bacterium]